MFRAVASLIVFVALVTTANADEVFDYNAEGLEVEKLIGHTSIGATRDTSHLLVLTVGKDEKFVLTTPNGGQTVGTWRRPSDNSICFKDSAEAELGYENCALMRPNGRGTDFRNIENLQDKPEGGIKFDYSEDEHRGELQIVYSFPRGHLASNFVKRPKVSDWGGKVIVGRTLKDRETWLARFDHSGTVDFAYGSGRRYQGSYNYSGNRMCISFPSQPTLGGCREPIMTNGKYLWTNPETGKAISEILFGMSISSGPLTNDNNLWAMINNQIPKKATKAEPSTSKTVLPTLTQETAKAPETNLGQSQRYAKTRAEVRNAIDDILSDYSFGTGTYSIKTTGGESLSFEADTRLSIRMLKPNGNYLEGLCGVAIESSFVPHERKITKNGYTYTLPEPSRNKFELTFGFRTAMTYMEAVGPPLNHLEPAKSGYVQDIHAYRLGWDNGVNLISSTGSYASDTSTSTFIQMPRSADKDEFWKKLLALRSVCSGF